MNLSHVFCFLAGFAVMAFILWIYAKNWEKKQKRRVVEFIGPDLAAVRFACEIHSYDISKNGTQLRIAIRDEDGSRSIFTCTVPEELPKRFPPGDRYYLTLEDFSKKKDKES